LNLNAVITNAEIYAVNVIKTRLEASGIKEGTTDYKIIIARTADLLVHHKEEVRDMYKKNKALLQRWIIGETHMEDLKAFRKMQKFGFTGDIVEDMKKVGADR
jgi:hypothetical protein